MSSTLNISERLILKSKFGWLIDLNVTCEKLQVGLGNLNSFRLSLG